MYKYKRNTPLSGYSIKRGDKVRLQRTYEYMETRHTYRSVSKGSVGHVVRAYPPEAEVWFGEYGADISVDINDLQVLVNGKWSQATWDLNDNPRSEGEERFGFKVSKPYYGENGVLYYLMEYNLDDESDWTIIGSYSTRIAAEHAMNVKQQKYEHMVEGVDNA